MKESIIRLLEQELLFVINEYKRRAAIAQVEEEYVRELELRALVRLIERESKGLISGERILKECGLRAKELDERQMEKIQKT